MENFTWDDLAIAISKLTDDQRKQPAFIQIEDEEYFKRAKELSVLDSDVLVNKNDENDFATLEVLKGIHGEEFNEESYEVVTPKGTPYLWIDF